MRYWRDCLAASLLNDAAAVLLQASCCCDGRRRTTPMNASFRQGAAARLQCAKLVLCKVTSSPTLAAAPHNITKHVVWLRHLDWHLPAKHVAVAIQQALEVQQLHQHVQHLDVPAATAGAGISKQQHKGYALISFTHEDAAQQSLTLLAQLPLGKDNQPVAALLAPHAVLPASWPAHARVTQQEYKAEQERQQQLIAERAKLRRQRVRRREQYVAGLAELLAAIPAPGGLQALDVAYRAVSDLYACATEAEAHEMTTAALQPKSSMQEASKHQLAAGNLPSTGTMRQEVFVDWQCMPDACQVTVRSIKGKQEVPLRVQRKRAAVESFARALSMLLGVRPRCGTHVASAALDDMQPKCSGPASSQQDYTNNAASWRPVYHAHVIEFGSGSGNLVLPLAWLFPDLHFHAVDCKAASVQLLQQRAQTAGLNNLTVEVGRIESFSGRMDVALALHACGSATDYAMLQAAAARAAYIISPCCVGKIDTSAAVQRQPQIAGISDLHPEATANGNAGRDVSQLADVARLLSHPRSQWLSTHLPSPVHDAFQRLAQAADISESESHGYEQLARLAKANVELDRNRAMQEAGYITVLTRLLQPDLHEFKSDFLIGVPQEAAGHRFKWPKHSHGA